MNSVTLPVVDDTKHDIISREGAVRRYLVKYSPLYGCLVWIGAVGTWLDGCPTVDHCIHLHTVSWTLISARSRRKASNGAHYIHNILMAMGLSLVFQRKIFHILKKRSQVFLLDLALIIVACSSRRACARARVCVCVCVCVCAVDGPSVLKSSTLK